LVAQPVISGASAKAEILVIRKIVGFIANLLVQTFSRVRLFAAEKAPAVPALEPAPVR
jgi:hypothetical protein